MTARLSVRWVVAVGILSLFLTAVISGTLLAVLGYPVAGKVKDTLGKMVGVFLPPRPADTTASAEVDRLRAQVESLQAQLDDARRQLQRERAQSSRFSPSGTASPGTNPNGTVPGTASVSGTVPPSNAGGSNTGGINPAGGVNPTNPAVPATGQDI
ncbi:MAG: hypothetical protein IRY98_05705, partial [Alicyclobacillaceae bacterium]|nr:hypothetical protein [Alicyclobacillaceae bacterium]